MLSLLAERRPPVVRKLSVREVRANLADLLNIVYYTNESVIVERKGKPVAVLVSPDQFARLPKEKTEKSDDELWATIERIRERNKDKDPEEVYREVTAIVEEVRRELHDREQVRKHSTSGR
jgi:prevent-host-death family protein